MTRKRTGGERPTPSDRELLAVRAAASPDDDTLQLALADCLEEGGAEADAIQAAGIRATVAIRQAGRAKMHALDEAAGAAHAACVAQLRAMCTEGVAADDPANPVCVLVAK